VKNLQRVADRLAAKAAAALKYQQKMDKALKDANLQAAITKQAAEQAVAASEKASVAVTAAIAKKKASDLAVVVA